MGVACKLLMATWNDSSLEIHLRSIFKGVFDGILIKVLIDIVVLEMSSAASLGFNRPRVLHPAAFINIVDQEVTKAAS